MSSAGIITVRFYLLGPVKPVPATDLLLIYPIMLSLLV